LALALLFTVAGCSNRATESPSDFGRRLVNADTEPQNWMSTGRGYDETRHSPLTQINVDNVGRLGLAWSYDLDTDRGQEATPLVVDGVMYTTSAWSKVQAFDAASGKLLWQFDPKVSGADAAKSCCDVISRGPAYWDGMVYVGALDGRLIALDARTGKQVWSTLTVDNAQPYVITGAPRIIKGRVIIGNSGAERGVRGYVSAYDAKSGRMSWRFYTVPGEPGKADGAASDAAFAKFAARSWSGEWWTDQAGHGGGTVWDSMAYDPELDLLYIGVGNAGVWNPKYRSSGGGDNLFVSSILALRPETGEYVWHFQETPGDRWDYTATQHMVLAELKIGGRQRKVIMQAPKNGFFYILDRATGKFISGTPYVPNINWTTGLDKVSGRPTINPAALYEKTSKPFVAIPGTLGGHNWQPMAYNSQTGLVYIPVHETSTVLLNDPSYKALPNAFNGGVDLRGQALPDDPANKVAALKGYLLAWDPVAGKEVWRAANPTFDNGGVLSTAGNLVVQGDTEGFLNIYDARTGRKLWNFDAGSGIVAAPISWSAKGRQYISLVVGFGGGVALFGGEGAWGASGPRRNKSRVLTFALDGKASLPPREQTMQAPVGPPPQFANARMLEEGEQAFNRTCLMCHGPAAVSGGVLPDLRHSPAIADADTFFAIVHGGILGDAGMPSFKRSFTPAQIEAVRGYIISRARMDAKRGG
jgi:alcohol dehydrogenase (cytochrome c)/quinohemoprotein ethanol dehydrogenase